MPAGPGSPALPGCPSGPRIPLGPCIPVAPFPPGEPAGPIRPSAPTDPGGPVHSAKHESALLARCDEILAYIQRLRNTMTNNNMHWSRDVRKTEICSDSIIKKFQTESE